MAANLQRRHDQLLKEVENLKSYQQAMLGSKKRLMKVAKMLVTPGETGPVPSPCLFPARAATRHFTRTYTVANPGGISNFGIQLRPELHDFVSIQAGAVVVPIVHDLRLSGATVKGEKAAVGSFYDDDPALQVLDPLASTRVGADAAGFARFDWTTPTVGVLNSVVVSNFNILPVRCVLRVYHTGGHTDFANNIGSGTNWIATATATAGVNTWLGIGIAADFGSSGGPAQVEFNIRDVNAVSITTDSLTRGVVKDSLVDLGQVDRYRVTAMSVLASYRGNLLENAGVIASARVPSRWIPGGATLYESICKLPEDSYRGPLINGAYSWWLPMDLSELDMKYPGAESETTSLFIGGTFSDAGAALELRVDIVVEFYSPLQIFERNLLPAWTPEFNTMLFELAELPAATCNPSHMELLKSGAKKAMEMGKRAYDFGKANPELISLFMKGLSALAM